VLLGYNTNGFGSHSLDSAVDVIAGLGYCSIGLSVDYHALDPFVDDAKDRALRCREQLERCELLPVVETGARFLLDPWRKHRPNLMDSESAARQRRVDFLLHCVQLVGWLGGKTLSLWSGAVSSEEPCELLDSRLMAGLQVVCDAAAEQGCIVAFEPEPGMHIQSMADYDRISAQFQHEAFKLTLDLGHAHLTESSVEETILRYADRIANVHVEGMRRPHHDHLVPWDSGYDVRAALGVLRDTGYTGAATLELSRSGHDAVEIARRAYAFLS
jgi:sugar phosphate isomerase/epimerase